ncbi:unnamed protein product [Lasius platythorax]|uniref:Uncharacterized protein n=1 Tax=Lasius platythorax TaxID=488582 RepID=A0AAV2NEB0_9HYME
MYDKEKLLNVITNDEYRTVDDDGKIFPPSHKVYGMISEALINGGSLISPKHVYTILKNDRSGMYSAVLKAFGGNKKYDDDSKDSTIYDDSKDSTFFNVSNSTSTSEI